MKAKLMTKLALSVAVACAAHASAKAGTSDYYYIWNLTDVKASTDNPLSSTKYSAYFFAVSDPNSVFTTTTEADVIAEVNKGSSGNLSSLNYVKTANSTTSGSTAKFAYINEKANTTSSASFIALILDSTSLDTAKNYMIAKTSNGTGNTTLTSKTGYHTDQGGYNYSQWDWGSQKNNTWTAVGSVVVPEPTSGVLLLVGIAALALKRKKAA